MSGYIPTFWLDIGQFYKGIVQENICMKVYFATIKWVFEPESRIKSTQNLWSIDSAD